MTTKPVNFRVDENLKAKAEELLDEMGLTMSSALNLFLQQMVNRRALPFTVEGNDPFYSKVNQELLKDRIKKYQEGSYEEHEIVEVE